MGHRRALWLTSAGAVAMNPALYDALTYDMQRDFTPVSHIVNNVEVLVVNPANPARDAADLVARSKQAAAPMAIASSGIGSMPHLVMELMADSTKANLLHVGDGGRGALVRKRSSREASCQDRYGEMGKAHQ